VSFIHLVYSSLPFSTVHTLHGYTTFYIKKNSCQYKSEVTNEQLLVIRQHSVAHGELWV